MFVSLAEEMNEETDLSSICSRSKTHLLNWIVLASPMSILGVSIVSLRAREAIHNTSRLACPGLGQS